MLKHPNSGRLSPGGTSTQATSVSARARGTGRLSPQVADWRDLKSGQEQYEGSDE